MKKKNLRKDSRRRDGSRSDASTTAETIPDSIEKELKSTQQMCGDLFGNPSKELKTQEVVVEIRCANAESARRIRETLNSANATTKKLSQTTAEYRNYRRDQERLVSNMRLELDKRDNLLKALQKQRTIELSAWKSKFERASASQLRVENKKLLSTIEDMRAQEIELRAIVTKFRTNKESRQREQKNRTHREVAEKVDRLQSVVGSLREELSDKERHCETLDTTLTATKVKLARAESEARRLRERNQLLVDKDIAHLKGTVRKYKEEASTMRGTVDELRKERANNADELGYLHEQNKNLRKLNYRLKAGIRESEIVKGSPKIVIATGTETAEQLRLANMKVLELQRDLSECRRVRKSSSCTTKSAAFALGEGEKNVSQQQQKRIHDLERICRVTGLELNFVKERLTSELDARLKMSLLVHHLLGGRSVVSAKSARRDAMRLAREATTSVMIDPPSNASIATMTSSPSTGESSQSKPVRVAVWPAHTLGSSSGSIPSEKASAENDNVIVVFSESFLGFTLVSTGDSECPAIISAFQRFEDGALGPAERCGTIGVGDALASIDGKSVRGMSYKRVVEELRGSRRPVVIEWTPKYYAPTRLVRISGLNVVDHTTSTPPPPNSASLSKSGSRRPVYSPTTRSGASRASTPQTTPRKISCDDAIFTPRSRANVPLDSHSVGQDFLNGTYNAWERCEVAVSSANKDGKVVLGDLLRGLRDGAALKTWVESLLLESLDSHCQGATGTSATPSRCRSNFVRNLQRGIELERLNPTEIAVLVEKVLPALCESKNLTLRVWQRQKLEIWTDLRVRVEHARQP